MKSKYEQFFTIWQEHHRQMEETIAEIERVIYCLEDKGREFLSKSLSPKIETLKAIFIDHSQQEERELIPILREMYGPETEIGEYVKDEHMFIVQELCYILGLLKSNENLHASNVSVVTRIQSLLEELLVHIFEEENGLFPLVQGYIRR